MLLFVCYLYFHITFTSRGLYELIEVTTVDINPPPPWYVKCTTDVMYT